ncbi:MAG TPA: hypothetical protein VJA22_02580 [Patescibacteria group bacterium]|nr:hypothetical protein [Patescibacteria group bacterium]
MKTGKNLDEKYHTVPGWKYYQARFLWVASMLDNCILIDASGEQHRVLKRCIEAIQKINHPKSG